MRIRFKRTLSRLLLLGSSISLLPGCFFQNKQSLVKKEYVYTKKRTKSHSRAANAIVYGAAGFGFSILSMPFILGIAMLPLVSVSTITIAAAVKFTVAVVIPGTLFIGLGNYFLNKAGENIVGS